MSRVYIPFYTLITAPTGFLIPWEFIKDVCMTTLLVIIYLSFISLGLPDSLLGSAWPVMQGELAASMGTAGYVTMTVSAGTILSSLLSNRLITRFGTGRVTAVSVAMTAAALFGYALSPSVGCLFLCAIPMGLGAGSVDAALNNFVANHYKAKHMNWLHCFWGIGATMGPAIMSLFLMRQSGWRMGYTVIASIQAALVAVLLITLPLWKKHAGQSGKEAGQQPQAILTNKQAMKLPLIKLAFIAFIFFSGTETTGGLWSSSFLVDVKGLDAAQAAQGASCFYAAITLGRLISGFASIKLPSHQLIRAGELLCVSGAVVLLLPAPPIVAVLGIFLVGLGTAPVYPGLLHETPRRFGEQASQAVMGLQMAVAYIGGTLFPPLFGALASAAGLRLFPYFLLVSAAVLLVSSEVLQHKLAKREQGNP